MELFDLKFYFKETHTHTHIFDVSNGQRPRTSLHLSSMSVASILFCVLCSVSSFRIFWSTWNFYSIFIWFALWIFNVFHALTVPFQFSIKSRRFNMGCQQFERSNVAFSPNLIHKILHLIDFAYMLILLFVFLAVWQPNSFLLARIYVPHWTVWKVAPYP